jgi:hypothetical protein
MPIPLICNRYCRFKDELNVTIARREQINPEITVAVRDRFCAVFGCQAA